MKTLLLLLILIPTLVEARTVNVVVGQATTASTPDACSACPETTAGTGNVACEDLEKASTNYLCDGTPTWTESGSGTGYAVAEDTAHSGTLACTDKGTHALQITYPSDAGSAQATMTVSVMTSFYYKFYLNIVDTGLSGSAQATITVSAMTSFYYKFYLNIVDTGLSGSFKYMPVIVVDGASYNNHYIRAVYDVDADHYRLQLRYRNTSTNTVGSATTGQLTEGTWYQVAVEGVTNSNTLKMWVGTVGGTQNLINSETDAANDADPVDFVVGEGAKLNDSISGVFQIDSFKLDNTSMPGDCSL